MGILDKLRQGLSKTRDNLSGKLKSILTIGRTIDDDLLDELEEALLSADIGIHTANSIIEELREAYRDKEITNPDDLKSFLVEKLVGEMSVGETAIEFASSPPTVILVVGVNGSGKTTSIAKLSQYYFKEGKKVLLAAGDTFRAAAVEQLDIWTRRIGIDIVKHQEGADAAAVVFDAAEAAKARNVDLLIVDTAGRLHTADNLMRELGKIQRVLEKSIPGAPHEVIQVLDATTGQNAIQQVKEFLKVVRVTGLFLSKLDGTAKGGVVLAINREVQVPVKFIGLGETPDDMEIFDPESFVRELFE